MKHIYSIGKARGMLLMLFLCLNICIGASAQLVTTIPDDNFRAFLKEKYPDAFIGDKFYTQTYSVLVETDMDVKNKDIKNLEGLQFFTSLRYLNCSYNQLSTLPELPLSLVGLGCNNNRLSSLPALPTTLKNLICEYNQLSSLPELPSSLSLLTCGHNFLEALPSNLPYSLVQINCEFNKIKELPGMIGFMSISHIYCNDNLITSLPALPSDLINLTCHNNYIKSLPNLPGKLRLLNCSNNPISYLPALPNTLCGLYCDRTGIDCLPNIPTCKDFIGEFNFTGPLVLCPQIKTSLSFPENYCQGDSISISYVATGEFKTGNEFLVQMVPIIYDMFGRVLGEPIVIGKRNGNETGSVDCKIPSDLATDKRYYFQVVSTKPHVLGTINDIQEIGINPSYSTLAVTGISEVCTNQPHIIYSAEKHEGSIYKWTLPEGVSIEDGKDSASIRVKWGQKSGKVTVKEINNNVCVASSPASLDVKVKPRYYLGEADVFCDSVFSIPVKVSDIDKGIIGLDFELSFDTSSIAPTGEASLGTVPGTYGNYNINVRPGVIYVSIYLDNPPANTFFQGGGDIIFVNFKRKKGVGFGAKFAVSINDVQESYLNKTTSSCKVGGKQYEISGMVKGAVLYRGVSYKALSSSGIPTVITNNNDSCTIKETLKYLTDVNGQFNFNKKRGFYININREIPGDVNVPVLNCSNVQSVINSKDRSLLADIITSKNINPSIYELLSADVNLDGKVTAGDLSLLTSRIVNSNNCEFPQTNNYIFDGNEYKPSSNYRPSLDWLFIDETTIGNPNFASGASKSFVPKVTSCLPVPAGFASCSPVVNTRYHAILLGDIDGNWNVGYRSKAREEVIPDKVIIDLDNVTTSGRGNYQIPVYYSSEQPFTGLDFSLDFNENLDPKNVYKNTDLKIGTQWNEIGGKRIMVTSFAEEGINTTSPVLFMEISAEEKIQAEDFTNVEAYLNGEPADVEFSRNSRVDGISNSVFAQSVKLFPNPSVGETYINVALASPLVQISVTGIDGTLIYANNEVQSGKDLLLPMDLVPGIYFIKVSTGEGTVIKQLIKY